LLRRVRRLVDPGKVNLEGRAVADLAVDPDEPPLCFTMPYTVARPSPVPFPFSLVVKNGSKRRRFVSSSMPTPVSLIERST
jgi:hypothetical protein